MAIQRFAVMGMDNIYYSKYTDLYTYLPDIFS